MLTSRVLKTLARIGSLFCFLIVLVLIGFWPSYWSQITEQSNALSFYFHFHAFFVSMWIMLLILQPIFIIKENRKMHRLLGKTSYAVFPLMLISILWVAHFSFNAALNPPPIQLFIPFKDILLLCIMFGIGIHYRRKPVVHAKAMIATGIVCIEPALIRTVMICAEPTSLAYPITITIIYSIIIGFIVYERNHSSGRWILPGLLSSLLISHSFILSGYESLLWNHFTNWFSSLPLT